MCKFFFPPVAGACVLCLAVLPGCSSDQVTADAFVPTADAFVPTVDAFAVTTPDAFVPVGGDANMAPDAYEPSGGGCGWDGTGFVCGTTARPPMGTSDVTCDGDVCTYTEPGATCFTRTCDYSTGEITECAYRAGSCPCEVVESCGAP